MQSSQPIDITKLPAIFNQYDTDHDGQVNDSQINDIFNQIGYTNVYIGSIRKIVRLLNIQNQDNKTLNFFQVQQYVKALATNGKFELWRAKLQTLQSIKKVQQLIHPKQQQQNDAAPGATPGASSGQNKQQSSSQQGQINLNIGQGDFNQQIDFSLTKQKGEEIKPFIKITIERQTNQQAQKIQSLFNKLYETLIEIIKAEQEQFINEVLSISFLTSVNGNVFTLFITTGNKDILELIQLFGEFVDLIFKQNVDGKFQIKHKFNFDFSKFVTDENYNFYEMLVKNCQISVKWNVWEIFSNLRKTALNAHLFDDLKYDIQPENIFLIALLHCEKFTGTLEFESTSTQDSESKTKSEIAQTFKQLRNQLLEFQQSSGLDIIGLIRELDGKINIQAGIKDWRLNFCLQINGLTKILTEQIKFIADDDNDY